jgi:hypothetical protein
VTATNVDTGVARSSITNGSGNYLITALLPGNYEGPARLCREVDILITGGEGFRGLAAYRECLMHGTYDILQPDCNGVGGILTMRKVGAMAEAWGVPICPHASSGLAWAGRAQASAALGSMYHEIGVLTAPQLPDDRVTPAMPILNSKPFTFRDGELLVPQGPGLGLDLNEEAITFTAGLDPNLYKILYLPWTSGSALDLLRQIALELDLEPAHYRGDLVRQISQAIVHLNQSKKQHPILICDEAQLLRHPALEQLPQLLNFDMDSSHYLTLLLVGEPLLRRTLSLQMHEPLRQRIAVQYHLEGLSRECRPRRIPCAGGTLAVADLYSCAPSFSGAPRTAYSCQHPGPRSVQRSARDR